MTRRRHAFTLLELLVAIAIVGIISVSLFASMGIAFRARSSAEAAVEPPRTAQVAFDIIRDTLYSAMPPRGILAGAFVGTDGTDGAGNPGDDLVFYGTADALSHPEGANGEVKWIELTSTVQDGSTETVLVRRTVGNLLATTTENPDEEVICRGIAGFNLRYYDGTTWQDQWDSTVTANNNTLPSAIEVTLQLERPAPGGQTRILTFTRIFNMPCAISNTLDDGTDGPGTISQNQSAVSAQSVNTTAAGTSTTGTGASTGTTAKPGGK